MKPLPTLNNMNWRRAKIATLNLDPPFDGVERSWRGMREPGQGRQRNLSDYNNGLWNSVRGHQRAAVAEKTEAPYNMGHLFLQVHLWPDVVVGGTESPQHRVRT